MARPLAFGCYIYDFSSDKIKGNYNKKESIKSYSLRIHTYTRKLGRDVVSVEILFNLPDSKEIEIRLDSSQIYTLLGQIMKTCIKNDIISKRHYFDIILKRLNHNKNVVDEILVKDIAYDIDDPLFYMRYF